MKRIMWAVLHARNALTASVLSYPPYFRPPVKLRVAGERDEHRTDAGQRCRGSSEPQHVLLVISFRPQFCTCLSSGYTAVQHF